MNFIEELRWRGMIHDITPGTAEKLASGRVTGYVGYDPTAPSLHLGHLVPIMMQVHLQRHGHRPIALVGGATGMVGDPSGRSEERPLLDPDSLHRNQQGIKTQLENFLEFEDVRNPAVMANNYDWFREMQFLTFLRDVGKHLTVNYMMAKDSVKLRLEKGLSFTEFSYQLLQAYDFFWLFCNRSCVLQMGGSDQWGNITAGIELIRRKAGGEAYAITCPLITRSDGSKFGKSEGENVWLSPELTSPYRFYQYWLNCSDADAEGFIKTFTLIPPATIDEMIAEHRRAPQRRELQQTIARDITIRVHSEEACAAAVEASQILFGRGTTESLRRLSEQDLLAVFEGVPIHEIKRAAITGGINIVDLLSVESAVFSSKGEARRMIKQGGVSLNKNKIGDPEQTVTPGDLLNDSLLVVQRGKKNYSLLKII